AGVNVPGIRLVDIAEGGLGLEFIHWQCPPVRHLIPAVTDEPPYQLVSPTDGSDGEEDYDEIDMGTRAADWVDRTVSDLLMEKIGVEIAKLHLLDIIHGDLTTSNIIYCSGQATTIYVEDKAVDLYVLERAFASTHPDSESLFAYANHVGKDWDPIKKRLDEGEIVRLRGRKRTMVG
ncbi:hypothetical protein HD554DRAFT_1979440, partial [Boletus coccyginus]